MLVVVVVVGGAGAGRVAVAGAVSDPVLAPPAPASLDLDRAPRYSCTNLQGRKEKEGEPWKESARDAVKERWVGGR